MTSASARLRAAAGFALAAVLTWMTAGAAAAHGGAFGDQRYYRSSVTAIEPPVPGLQIVVHDGGESLTLTNRTGRTVTVLSYTGEAYLRITRDGVVENMNSLSSLLNDDLAIAGLPPKAADTARRGPPLWRHAADVPSFTWHDHRIHWMTQQRPPVVAADPTHPHRVFDWAIGLTVGDQPVTVLGTLSWTGAPASRHGVWLGAGALALAAALVAGLLTVTGRRPRGPRGPRGMRGARRPGHGRRARVDPARAAHREPARPIDRPTRSSPSRPPSWPMPAARATKPGPGPTEGAWTSAAPLAPGAPSPAPREPVTRRTGAGDAG